MQISVSYGGCSYRKLQYFTICLDPLVDLIAAILNCPFPGGLFNFQGTAAGLSPLLNYYYTQNLTDCKNKIHYKVYYIILSVNC